MPHHEDRIDCPRAGSRDRVTGFAVYRELAPFTSTEGRTPIGVVSNPDATAFTDGGAQNGTRYHYAVAARFDDGSERLFAANAAPIVKISG